MANYCRIYQKDSWSKLWCDHPRLNTKENYPQLKCSLLWSWSLYCHWCWKCLYTHSTAGRYFRLLWTCWHGLCISCLRQFAASKGFPRPRWTRGISCWVKMRSILCWLRQGSYQMSQYNGMMLIFHHLLEIKSKVLGYCHQLLFIYLS